VGGKEVGITPPGMRNQAGNYEKLKVADTPNSESTLADLPPDIDRIGGFSHPF
jgi:hypothetical protein